MRPRIPAAAPGEFRRPCGARSRGRRASPGRVEDNPSRGDAFSWGWTIPGPAGPPLRTSSDALGERNVTPGYRRVASPRVRAAHAREENSAMRGLATGPHRATEGNGENS